MLLMESERVGDLSRDANASDSVVMSFGNQFTQAFFRHPQCSAYTLTTGSQGECIDNYF